MHIAVCPASYIQYVNVQKVKYSDQYSALTKGEFCELKKQEPEIPAQ